MLYRKSDHHLNALRRRNRTKRPTAQTRHPGQWLVPRASRGDTVRRSSNGRLCYLKLHARVVVVLTLTPPPFLLSVQVARTMGCELSRTSQISPTATDDDASLAELVSRVKALKAHGSKAADGAQMAAQLLEAGV